MHAASTILDVQHATKKFGKDTVVNDVSFQIKEGEIYGLIGPNGAGKTTVIKTIVGHLRLTSGQIRISSYDISKEFADAIDFVGAIVEYPMHYQYMTGYQNLKLTANMYPEVTKERLEEVIDLVGLKSRIHDLVRKYSLGMRQRLGFAQALMEDPSLLILDEPLNGLDKHGVVHIRNVIKGLRAEGKTVILASHNQVDIDELCDTVCEMDAGVLTVVR